MQNMMQERALADAGRLRSNSNVGGGQMVTADFVLTPAVAFSENNAGGVGGATGGLLGHKAAVGGALFGGGAGAAGGGYGNTNEGKIIAAAFMDNYNKIVTVVRNDPSLARKVGTLKQEAAAGGTTKAGGGFNEGDVLVPKIANVKLMAQPSDTAKTLGTLPRGEELVVIGAEKAGYVNVQGAHGSGWVKVVLIQKR
jgi:hypothetical protein